MKNEEIWQLITDQKFKEADDAIRERLKFTNFSEKQISGLMYYAYDHGHSAGQAEVLSIALSLTTNIAEAS